MNNNTLLSPGRTPFSYQFTAPPLHPLLMRQGSPPQNIANLPISTPHRVIQAPISPPKPASDYLLHLVPQAHPSKNIPFNGPSSPPAAFHPHTAIFPHPQPQRQFIERNHHNQPQQNRDFRANTQQMDIRNATSSPQAFSQFNRYKGFSEFNPRINSQVQSREIGASISELRQPKSPKEVVNMQPVRRVSHYREQLQASDRKSNRSSSHHNIHIMIESAVEGELTPTITISPSSNKKTAESNLSMTFAHRIASHSPPPQHVTILQRPASISQTMITQQAPVQMAPQPVILSQSPPTIISHHPIFIQQPQPPSPQQVKYSQQENTLPSYSQLANNHHLINQTLMRERASTVSTQINRNHAQKIKKNSVQTMARQEYYNQLAEKQQQGSEQQNGCQNRTTGFSAYLTEERMLMNTRKIIDQIFKNETNRALLQMRVLQASSREKVGTRSNSKHYKKQIL